MSEPTVLITGCTGAVGTYATYFMARQGWAKRLVLVSHSPKKVATVMHNARVLALMEGHDLQVEHVNLDLTEADRISECLGGIRPTLIVNSAALMSLYPFFPYLKKRQERMNFIAGFAHTLPKDMALLWPLMRAVKALSNDTIVVNLAAPDMGNAILRGPGLSPTVGAGTIDSTVHGIGLAVSRRTGIKASELSIQMVCHHALRRFPPGEVPFFLQISHKGSDITNHFDVKELIGEAADVSGVETMTTSVSNNAAITAGSASAIARALLSCREEIRHAAGVAGSVGGTPVRLGSGKAEILIPDKISPEEAVQINVEGMRMSGVERVDEEGTATFTERERFWLREGLGLSWEKMRLEDSLSMAEELREAYHRLREEES